MAAGGEHIPPKIGLVNSARSDASRMGWAAEGLYITLRLSSKPHTPWLGPLWKGTDSSKVGNRCIPRKNETPRRLNRCVEKPREFVISPALAHHGLEDVRLDKRLSAFLG